MMTSFQANPSGLANSDVTYPCSSPDLIGVQSAGGSGIQVSFTAPNRITATITPRVGAPLHLTSSYIVSNDTPFTVNATWNQNAETVTLTVGTKTSTQSVPGGLTGTGALRISSPTRPITAIVQQPQLITANPAAPLTPKGTLDEGTSSGSRVTLKGWTFDPNDTQLSIKVAVHRDGTDIGWHDANTARPDVNTAYGIGANHGYAINLTGQPGGNHTYCVFAIDDTSAANNPLLGCYTATTTATPPTGNVDSVTPTGSGNVTLSGWALDFDDKSTSIPVAVYRDGIGISWFPTDTPRPDVNNAYGSTGNHGFNINLTDQPTGNHTYCTYAIDDAYTAGNPAIGCTTITVT